MIRLALFGTTLCWIGLLALACGYRPVGTTLPGGAGSVRVVQPNPARVDAPELSAMLSAELVRQLGRSGVRASTTGAAQSVLHTNLLALKTMHTTVDPVSRVVVARLLKLQLELRLADERNRTLWRSGLIEIEQTWPLSAGGTALSHEAGRRHALQGLAVQSARQVTELLTSGL